MPVIISGSTGISGTDGSAGTPAVQGTDGNTGMFFPAADTIAFAEGGVEVMRLDASGNVGIGTTTPTQRLHVAGAGSTYTRVSSSNAATGAGSFFTNASSAWLIGAGPASGGGEFAIVDQTSGSNERMRIDSSGNLQFNSGYGSVATAFGCRAWVNFNGTGTVAIRASGNVSSITDNGAGDYTVNFTNAMPNANFATVVSGCFDNVAVGTGNTTRAIIVNNAATGSVRVGCPNAGGTPSDFEFVNVSVFR